MSCSLSSKRWLGTALVVALGLVSAYADGQSEKIQFSGPGGSTNHVRSKPGEKIKFSSPADDVSSAPADNGASHLNSQPGAFRQAQEDILTPFVSMMHGPANSMQGVLAMPKPQRQSAPLSEHARQLLEQRRNWAFSDYNDLNNTTAGSLNGSSPDSSGNEDKSVSLVERYYQRLGRQQPNDRARSLKDAFDSATEYATHDEDWDPSTGASFMTDKKFLKQLDAFGANARKAGDRGVDDSASGVNLFGGSVLPDPNSIAALEAQQRRDDFQKLLNPNFIPAPAKSSLNPIYSEPLTPPASLATTLTPVTTVHRNPLNPFNSALADPTSTALRSSVFDNPTSAALGLPNPVAVTPQPQPMTLEKMQSMIDPTAVFKKHNF